MIYPKFPRGLVRKPRLPVDSILFRVPLSAINADFSRNSRYTDEDFEELKRVYES